MLYFQNSQILLADRFWRAYVHYHAKFRQNPPIHCRVITIFSIFQDGGRPPSWICLGHIWTTHERHLVVSITVQNLVVIDAVVLKI